MRRTVLIAVIPAVMLLAAGLAMAQHHGHGDHRGHSGPAIDTRELVSFPPGLAAHTLANMRDHLLALQEINDSLARGENDKAARIAEERLGMTSLRSHGAHEVAKYMPQGMQDAGTAMHRAASRFAIQAQDAAVTGNLKGALGALSEVMSACNGCHAGYRLK